MIGILNTSSLRIGSIVQTPVYDLSILHKTTQYLMKIILQLIFDETINQ